MSSTMKAIQFDSPGHASVHASAPLPSPPASDLLVRITAVALNPTDWKNIDAWSSDPAYESRTVGCDFAGVVARPSPSRPDLPEGTRVFGMINSRQPDNVPGGGAFAEFAALPAALAARTPDNLSDAEAATLGVGVLTIGQALHQSLGLPRPGEVKGGAPGGEEGAPWILVYGASTATGTLAVQAARLSGLRVAAACSPRNFDLVRGLGAELVADYKDAACGTQIREGAGGGEGVAYAMDCIGDKRSVEVCCEALREAGEGGPKPKYTTIIPTELPRKDVTYGLTVAYTAFGQAMLLGGGKEKPAKEEDKEFAVGWLREVQGLLAAGKLKVHPPEVRDGGLEGVLEGLKDLKEGKVSGKKLVYPL